jgi:hypothetical protein
MTVAGIFYTSNVCVVVVVVVVGNDFLDNHTSYCTGFLLLFWIGVVLDVCATYKEIRDFPNGGKLLRRKRGERSFVSPKKKRARCYLRTKMMVLT